MVLQCSVHALQLTAPQHTAVALVNFCNAVLPARASLKRFTLEFVHAFDYTTRIKPIFWSESNGKWSVKLKRDSFTTRSMEKSLTLSRHLQRVNSMHFAWYVDGISRSCTAAVMNCDAQKIKTSHRKCSMSSLFIKNNNMDVKCTHNIYLRSS